MTELQLVNNEIMLNYYFGIIYCWSYSAVFILAVVRIYFWLQKHNDKKREQSAADMAVRVSEQKLELAREVNHAKQSS